MQCTRVLAHALLPRRIKKIMAKMCVITKKGSIMGGGYSNRTRATKFNPTGKVRKYLNLQKKRIFIPELNKSINIKVSTQGMRTMKKNGAYATLLKAGLIQAK
jgi:large subunit ribosomal protein L28